LLYLIEKKGKQVEVVSGLIEKKQVGFQEECLREEANVIVKDSFYTYRK